MAIILYFWSNFSWVSRVYFCRWSVNIFKIEVILDQTGINCDEPTAPTPQIRIGYSYTVEDILFGTKNGWNNQIFIVLTNKLNIDQIYMTCIWDYQFIFQVYSIYILWAIVAPDWGCQAVVL